MKTVNQSSGLRGVTIATKNNGRNKYWNSRVQGKVKVAKLFPFTEDGKKKAAEFYKQTIKKNKDKYFNYTL